MSYDLIVTGLAQDSAAHGYHAWLQQTGFQLRQTEGELYLDQLTVQASIPPSDQDHAGISLNPGTPGPGRASLARFATGLLDAATRLGLVIHDPQERAIVTSPQHLLDAIYDYEPDVDS